jgi:transposase-like protein
MVLSAAGRHPLDNAEPDVLAYMTFPKEHRAKLHSTNPIERLNGEIKRRTEVVGILPNDNAIVCLAGTSVPAVV